MLPDIDQQDWDTYQQQNLQDQLKQKIDSFGLQRMLDDKVASLQGVLGTGAAQGPPPEPPPPQPEPPEVTQARAQYTQPQPEEQPAAVSAALGQYAPPAQPTAEPPEVTQARAQFTSQAPDVTPTSPLTAPLQPPPSTPAPEPTPQAPSPSPGGDWFGQMLGRVHQAGGDVQKFADNFSGGADNVMSSALGAASAAGADVQQFAQGLSLPPPQTTVTSSTGGGPPGGAPVSGVPDWLATLIAQNAPPELASDPDFIRTVAAGAKAESGWDINRVQQGYQMGKGGGARGLFQFDLGGMGAGIPEEQLVGQQGAAYQAAKIVPLYAQAYASAPPGLSGAEKASWVAAQAERPYQYDDPNSAARRNYATAYSQIGGSDQPIWQQAGNAALGAAQGAVGAVQQKVQQISQFGDKQLSADEAYAACGPAAAVRFASMFGRNPTLREATDLAAQVGWTSGQGMAGLGSEKSLMDKLGIPTHMVGADVSAMAREASTGNPVTISTPGHYFFADGYDAASGAFHVGQSGLDLKGGSEWMTPEQMQARMGQIQGALFADNPQIPAPSTADQSSNPLGYLGRLKDTVTSKWSDLTQGAQDVSQPVVDTITGKVTNPALEALGGLGQQKDAAVAQLDQAVQSAASNVGQAASDLGTSVNQTARDALLTPQGQALLRAGVANAQDPLNPLPPGSVDIYRQLQEARRQAVEERNPLANAGPSVDLPLVGQVKPVAALANMAADILTDPTNLILGPGISDIAEAATTRLPGLAGTLGKVAAEGGLWGGVQAASTPDITPEQAAADVALGIPTALLGHAGFSLLGRGAAGIRARIAGTGIRSGLDEAVAAASAPGLDLSTRTATPEDLQQLAGVLSPAGRVVARGGIENLPATDLMPRGDPADVWPIGPKDEPAPPGSSMDLYQKAGGLFHQAISGPVSDKLNAALSSPITADERAAAQSLLDEFSGVKGATNYYPSASHADGLAMLMRQLGSLADSGASEKNWYEDSSRAIMDLAQGNKADAEKIAQLVAIYSPQTGVSDNMNRALTAWYQWKAGLPIDAPGMGSANGRAHRLLYQGQDWGGAKTNNFYRNLMYHIDPEVWSQLGKVDMGSGVRQTGATIDIWMQRALNGLRKAPMGQGNYDFASRLVSQIGQDRGWRPDQAQAAIWSAAKAAWENAQAKSGKDVETAGYNYGTAIRDRLAQVLGGGDRIDSALRDENGRDVLANAFGILGADNKIAAPTARLSGLSAELGRVMTKEEEKAAAGTVEPRVRQALNAYTAAKAWLAQDEEAGWARPFKETTKRDQNARLITDRLSPDQIAELQGHLDDLTAPGATHIVPTDTGAWVLNRSDSPNPAFQKAYEKAIERLQSADSVSSAAARYDGEFFGHDWNADPSGQTYLDTIRQSGSRFADQFAALQGVLGEKVRAARDVATPAESATAPPADLSGLTPEDLLVRTASPEEARAAVGGAWDPAGRVVDRAGLANLGDMLRRETTAVDDQGRLVGRPTEVDRKLWTPAEERRPSTLGELVTPAGNPLSMFGSGEVRAPGAKPAWNDIAGISRTLAGSEPWTINPPSEEARQAMPNLMHIAGDMPEIQATLQRTAEDNPALMDKYRQGVVSHADLVKDTANKLGMTANDFLQTKVGKAFNPQELLALRAAIVDQHDQVAEMARYIQNRGGASKLNEEEKLGAVRQILKAAQLQAVGRGAVATAGRALNQQKINVDRGIASMLTRGNELASSQRALTVARAREAWANGRLANPLPESAAATTAGERGGDAARREAQTMGAAYDQWLKVHSDELKAQNNFDQKAWDDTLKKLDAEAQRRGWNVHNPKDATPEGARQWAQAEARNAAADANLENKRAIAAWNRKLAEGTTRRNMAGRILERIGPENVTNDMIDHLTKIMASDDPMAAAKYLQSLQKVSWWDRLSTMRYASMLSSTATHTAQALSNTGQLGMALATHPLAVGADIATQAVRGGERQRYMSELPAMLRGIIGQNPAELADSPYMVRGAAGGLRQGAQDAAEILRSGLNPGEVSRNWEQVARPGFGFEQTRLGQAMGAKGSGAVNAIAEGPLRALEAGDSLIRGAARGAFAHGLAERQAIREGYSGAQKAARVDEIIKNFDEFPELFQQADDAAKRVVMQEQRPGGLSSGLMSARKGPEGLALSLIAPFVRTPWNVAAQGAGMSPLGYAAALRSAAQGQRGEAVDRAARATLGTGIMGAAMGLGANGYLTGATPSDPSEKSSLEPNWQPYSLKIPHEDGSSTFIKYSNLGPAGVPLAAGAIMGDAAKQAQKQGDQGLPIDPGSLVFRMVGGMGRYMVDQTMLQGLSQAIDAVSDPERKSQNFAEGLVTQFAPYAAAGRQLDRTLGTGPRDTREGFQGLLDAVMASYPGLSGNVPARLDPLGREVQATQTGLGSLISPATYSQSAYDPLTEAMRNADVGVGATPKSWRNFAMNPDEQRQYQQQSGYYIDQMLREVLADPGYQNAPIAARQQILQRVISAARNAGGADVMGRLSNDELMRRYIQEQQRTAAVPR